MAEKSLSARRALADRPWTEVTGGSLLVIPLGATEQHGPHLPLDTDTAIAEELARRLVETRTDAVLAPALP
jgi:mycofactocin precursor peptide peptidase